MQVKTEELAALIRLQQNDMELLRVRKLIAELPQRAVIVEARKKIAAIEEKRNQVAALRESVEARLDKVSAEDAELAEKQRAEQAEMDAGAGYRDVEAHAKAMGGYAERREALEEELSSISAELEKLAAVEMKVGDALAEVRARESKAVTSFRREGGELKAQESSVLAVHDELAAQLPAELREKYERLSERRGGVAVAMLTEGRCGACRTPIEGGRLIDLKANAPLGECPNCKRMLIVS